MWKCALRPASPALSLLAHASEISLVGDKHEGPCYHFLVPVLVPAFAGCHQNVLVALRVLTVKYNLLACLVTHKYSLCVPASQRLEVRHFCGHRAAGVSSANENHLASCKGQMGARWRQAGRQAGSLRQWPVVSLHFPLPLLPLILVSWNARVIQD